MTAEPAPYIPSNTLFDRVRRRLAYEIPVSPAHIAPQGGLISFSFDDFPKSAAEAGAETLESAGARGCYYAARGLAGIDNHQGLHFDAKDVARLAAAGHEIACHSFSHLDCARASADEIAKDLDRNAAAMIEMGATAAMQSFAYPYGEVTLAAKRVTAKRFKTARGVRQGINAGRADLSSLLATPLEAGRADLIDRAKRAIEDTVARNGWLIFYTHDVRQDASDWGVRPADFATIVAAAKQSGARIVTVAQGADLIAPSTQDSGAQGKAA